MGAASEIEAGERFPFGENWRRFLAVVDEQTIESATAALADMLETTDLSGRRFLDIGCGSGLSSLAAHRLGAEVVSFDFDPASVACTEELRRRFGGDTAWTVLAGSVLDDDFLSGLGQFGIVYSWGVLHHTGRMWDACAAAARSVESDGQLFIALYNDQGAISRAWTAVKRRYNQAGPSGRRALELGSAAYLGSRTAVARLGRKVLRPTSEAPAAAEAAFDERGMRATYDLRDWVGGYPFEVASPGEVFEFHHALGFDLQRMRTVVNGHGCNEFVFRRRSRD